MKLLIFTQKVDKNDPVLGFFHNWIIKFSEGLEKLTVVCLQKGKVELDPQIKVFSLGKEDKKSRLAYILNFYKYIWQERKNYDTVFVHMNQEYILLGGIFWKLLGKKIFLWRNHPYGNILTNIAVWFSDKVFYTSPQSFVARFKKGKLMPVGVDIEKFKAKNEKRKINSILSLGRISPIKNIDKLIEVAILLDEKGKDFVLDIVGDPVNPEDRGYYQILKNKADVLVKNGKINFIPAVSQEKAVEMYQTHQVFVNLTPSGSMDKSILESISCGCIPVVVNTFFKEIFDPSMMVGENINEIAEKIEFWLEVSDQKVLDWSEKLQRYVSAHHSLAKLVEELLISMGVNYKIK